MDTDHRNDIPLPEWETPNEPNNDRLEHRRVVDFNSEHSNEQIGFEDDIEDQNPATYGNGVAHARNPSSEQQALQFRARHIQMMALGNSPTSMGDAD